MQAELEVRRRLLVVTYRRYLEADRAWNLAVEETRTWFPVTDRPGRSVIGDPGSPVRRAYERRERAVVQIHAARRKLEEAKERLASRNFAQDGARLRLVGRLR